MSQREKNVLITSGNTRVPIDKVRGIDNIFRGRTGAAIAEYFADSGCQVKLLTSHPDTATPRSGLDVDQFDTYDDLYIAMEMWIRRQSPDIIIHSAAVSDYRVAGMYRRVGDSSEAREIDGRIQCELEKLDSSGKVGSDHSELWMKMVPTIKIVDQIRRLWGFRGTLVKFKLQVGMSDAELIDIATRSMHHSEADFIVANTLEGMNEKAFIISAKGGEPLPVSRPALPAAIYRVVLA